ncbi:unnamed protein product [Durusdinium trenchii]|uniref:Uncharacterized protein n=1 Tax=Durusdinium trenchii TaxID=1381693 RepID=A0ABP0JW75_9DINO
MDAVLAVFCVITVWLPVHVRLTQSDFGELRRWLSSMMQPEVKDGLKETRAARIDAEMVKLRQRYYKSISKWACHMNFFTLSGLIYEAFATPGLDTFASAFFCFCGYLQHLMVGHDLVELTALRLRILSCTMHVMLTLQIISTVSAANSFKFAMMQGFQVALRFCPVVLFLDPWITIPFQFIYTAVDMSVYLLVFDKSSLELGPLCVSQFFILVATVASSIFIDRLLRGRFDALLHTTDAECLVQSFRRVLRGLCDGEVLLDSQMNVAQESEGLKHLILTDVSLRGRSFQQLLVEDERTHFGHFMENSTRALHTTTSQLDALPLGCRLRFRGSAGIGVAADIFHVPVPGLFGSSDPYHLIAFKEDSDSRPLPDSVDDAIPSELCCLSPSSFSSRRLDAASSGSARSVENACPELQEMFLLVDVTTELQDIQQAQLNFLRDMSSETSSLHSSMPSLRKLVKPTDWEQVRSSVARFARKAQRSEATGGTNLLKGLRGMSVQLPGQSGWLIPEEATLHHVPNSQKVWLYLKGLRPEKKPRRLPTLEEIHEVPPDRPERGLRRRRSEARNGRETSESHGSSL